MKITIILALTFAAVCALQDQSIPEDPLQQDIQRNLIQDVETNARQKRANCNPTDCNAICSKSGLKGYCSRRCRCA